MAEISNHGRRMLEADAARRSSVSAADSDDLATFKATHAAIDLKGKRSLFVWLASSVADNFALLEVVLFAKDSEGNESTTIEPLVLPRIVFQFRDEEREGYYLSSDATTLKNSADAYLSKPVEVDVLGWPLARVRVVDLKAGSIDIYGGLKGWI